MSPLNVMGFLGLCVAAAVSFYAAKRNFVELNCGNIASPLL